MKNADNLGLFRFCYSDVLAGPCPASYHVHYQGQEALIAIETGEVIAGIVPRRAVGILREWVLSHKAELMDNWERGRQREPFLKVPGADRE